MVFSIWVQEAITRLFITTLLHHRIHFVCSWLASYPGHPSLGYKFSISSPLERRVLSNAVRSSNGFVHASDAVIITLIFINQATWLLQNCWLRLCSLLPSGESSATSISGVTSPDDIDSPVPESDITNTEDEKEKHRGTSWKNNGRGCRPYYEGTRGKWWQICPIRGKRTRLEEKLLQSEEKQRQQDSKWKCGWWWWCGKWMLLLLLLQVCHTGMCSMPHLGTDNFFPTAYAPSPLPSPSYDYHQASFRFYNNGDY